MPRKWPTVTERASYLGIVCVLVEGVFSMIEQVIKEGGGMGDVWRRVCNGSESRSEGAEDHR